MAVALMLAMSSGCKKKDGIPSETDSTKAAAGSKIKPGQPFENSLGVNFIPVPGTQVLMSVWETRRQDFAAYLLANGAPVSSLNERPNYPINNVSWNDATDFCRWLTEQERQKGVIGPKDRYRLPTSAEWTAAIGKERYPWGKKWPTLAQRPTLGGYLPNDGDNFGPVGSQRPNEQGFYDLGGNLYEWGEDWYQHEMNSRELRLEFKRLEIDGDGHKYKILRGASWVFFDPLNLQSAYHYPSLPGTRGGFYGFRCVLEPGGGELLPAAQIARSWRETPSLSQRAREGRDVFVGRCSECHQLYDPSGYPDDEWDTWIGKMIPKAKLRRNEGELVQEFIKTVRVRADGT